jgi:hypothetical protein
MREIKHRDEAFTVGLDHVGLMYMYIIQWPVLFSFSLLPSLSE